MQNNGDIQVEAHTIKNIIADLIPAVFFDKLSHHQEKVNWSERSFTFKHSVVLLP